MLRRLFLSVVLLSGFGASASATESLLSGQRFDVAVRDQDVVEVLAEVSSAIDVPILVSDVVAGRVSASFEGASAEEVLDGLARAGALDWRVDGNRIRVTARSEQITRIVDLDGVTLGELVEALEALGVFSDGFRMTAVDADFGMIVAPPDYVAVVEVVLGALSARRAEEEAKRLAAEAERDELRALAERQRIEFARIDRLERREAAERERERLQELRREQELRARRGPNLIRNGVWGG